MALALCLPLKLLAVDLSFKEIIFFGDSLTDDGNFYSAAFGLAPKSPPYYQGRFTNGPTWAENLAVYYSKENGIKYDNYAVGGATTLFHNPFKGYFPTTLSGGVTDYILRTSFQDRSNSLFVIWIGSNDYLYGAGNVSQTTTDVVNNIQHNVERLIAKGGRNFLLMNIPDISQTPQGLTGGVTQNIRDLTLAHNTKLMIATNELQNKYKNIKIYTFDIYRHSIDLIENIDRINREWNTHFTNLTDPCWQGGYMDRSIQSRSDRLTQQIEEKLQERTGLQGDTARSSAPQLDARALAEHITSTPDLSAAYDVGESASRNGRVCSNPDNYVFWDKVHPTAIVHSLYSAVVIDFINHNYLTSR